jgi:hypothetical protein
MSRIAHIVAGALALSACLPAAPAGAQTTRVSVATDGTQANGPSKDVVISRDGKIVAFSSDASNLVTGDTNGVRDVFVRDIAGNTTTRISVASDGTERPEASGAADVTLVGLPVTFPGTGGLAISDDGNIVAFTSSAAFDAADVNSCADAGSTVPCVDIYVRDRTSGQTTRVSVASDGTQANGHSTQPRLSGDGRYVLFASTANNLVVGDTNNVSDIFLHDRVTHATTRVSVGAAGQQGTFASTNPTISADGRVVGFIANPSSFGDLLPATCGDPCARAFVRTLANVASVRWLPLSPSWEQNPPSPSMNRVFASRLLFNADGTLAIVQIGFQASLQSFSTFEYHDLESGAITVSSGPFGARSLGLSATSDGRTVAVATGASDMLSISASAWILVIDRSFNFYQPVPATPSGVWTVSPSLSATGRLLAFSSEETALVIGDTNSAADIFVLDRDPDNDGMPTVWETFYGLDPNAANGAVDTDSDGQTNLQEYLAGTHPTATQTRYFAEGAANSFFSTRIALANPGATDAAVLVRFLGQNGLRSAIHVTVPANSRRTLLPRQYSTAPDAAFSSIVESDQPIVSDRLMTWDATGYGSSLETSVAAPGTTWYLAEGATGSSYSLYYLLQNPGDIDTDATVTYLLPTPQPPVTKTYHVPANSRFTIDVRGEAASLAHAEVSAKITSTQPLVVERSLYMSAPGQPFAAGHDGAALPAPATRWFLAEGATGFFDEYVLIANADASRAQIKVTYLLEGGQAFSEAFPVDGNSRYTIDVKSRDPRLLSTPVSVIVESTNSVPVVVERAMWWPHGNWYEASLSAGVTATGTKWAFAEGEKSTIATTVTNKTQTYVLIANTDLTTAATVTVTLLRETGAPLTTTVPVPAKSRRTVDLASAFPGLVDGLYGIVVESNGVPIVAERAIYSTIDGVTYAAGATSVGTNLAPVP